MFWTRHTSKKEDVEETADMILNDMERETILMNLGDQLGSSALMEMKNHVHSLRVIWAFMSGTKFKNNVLHEEQLYFDGSAGNILVNSRIKNCYSVRSMNPIQDLHFIIQITCSDKGITRYTITGNCDADFIELEKILHAELLNYS